MDSSIAQQHHETGLESMLVCTKAQQQEKKARPADAQGQKCPRCDSSNTKFCYYNNYSLSQPRYFCKSCRRYWTKGGTLRNVPVGGGCRRPNKRPSSTSKRSQEHPNPGSNNPFSAEDFSVWGNYDPHHHHHGGDHFLDSQLPPIGGGIQNLHYGNHLQLETEIPHEGRVLWGFPWMQGGDGNVADMDSGGRSLSWNGIGTSSNWQGLLNSPLM